jgi:hypothetical protein
LNYTIMHLSTTTKNKLQRIKYNKVWNKNQLGTLFNTLPKFESVTYTIWNSKFKWHHNSPVDQTTTFPTPCYLQENQHFWTNQIFFTHIACMHRISI